MQGIAAWLPDYNGLLQNVYQLFVVCQWGPYAGINDGGVVVGGGGGGGLEAGVC